MQNKWMIFALLFSVTVNIAVVGTLFYFWQNRDKSFVDVSVNENPQLKKQDIFLTTECLSPSEAKEIDSLRNDYFDNLVILRKSIDDDRRHIVRLLQNEPPDRDSLNTIIIQLSEKQINAERLTINHLLEIKPLLSRDNWLHFVRDLEPKQIIRTKVIKLDGNNKTQIITEEETDIEEIRVFKHSTK